MTEGTDLKRFQVVKRDYDDDWVVHSAHSREEAEMWMCSYKFESSYDILILKEWTGTMIGELQEDGSVQVSGGFKIIDEWEYVPARYHGDIYRVRIHFDKSNWRPHRMPIDCFRPEPSDTELTEDRAWRVVQTQCCGTDRDHLHSSEEFIRCHCGEWIEIEGSLEAIYKDFHLSAS